MIIEQSEPNIHNIEYSGIKFNGRSAELKEFLINCSGFMDIDAQSFEIMIQSISDHLIDDSSDETTMSEIRPQLKFLREINFFLKGLLPPVNDL